MLAEFNTRANITPTKGKAIAIIKSARGNAIANKPAGGKVLANIEPAEGRTFIVYIESGGGNAIANIKPAGEKL